jgi:uncharacterized membrane protein
VRRRAHGQEDGLATLVLPLVVWLATVVAVVVIDIGAYLASAARAQTLADSAALAASADAIGPERRGGCAEASRVASAGGGRVEECVVEAGGRARVAVSVEVRGLVVPRVGARRVGARAAALLVP